MHIAFFCFLVYVFDMTNRITSLSELSEFAKILINELIPQEDSKAQVILLEGNLGAGKTALVKACAIFLGIQEDITSPTFVIQKEYKIKEDMYFFKKMIHIDAYRLEKPSDMNILGWNENIAQANNIIFVEWPSYIQGVDLPEKTVTLNIEICENEDRIIIKTE